MDMTATYSPDDNKLRLTSVSRLDTETFARVKEAGFRWAPRQGQFIAPMWTPKREDLLIELCGEIADEDAGLLSIAEDRAERFNGYAEKRTADAQAARRAVSAITEGIPLGQPILVGHHSERHARKHAERIEAGMQRAVRMWETATYWTQRAAAALRHAKYKESAEVRHRRIKTIEADARKMQRELDEIDRATAALQLPDLTAQKAMDLCDLPCLYGLWTQLRSKPEDFAALCAQRVETLAQHRTHYARWAAHYAHRLSYERAMLAEQGGIAADGFNIQAGGQVQIGSDWVTVVRVNRKDGRIVSVTTKSRFVPVRGIEEVRDYRAPSEDAAAATAAAAKKPPLCNYPGEGFEMMTKAQWERIHKDYKGSRELGQGAIRPRGYRPDVVAAVAGAANHGRHRVRAAIKSGQGIVAVYLSDMKRTDPPAAQAAPAAAPAAEKPENAAASPAAVSQGALDLMPAPAPAPAPAPVAAPAPAAASAPAAPNPGADFEAMRAQLRSGGVQVVSAPQLFPTPPDLAARMADLADLRPGLSVLEPSAGTGNLLRAIRAEAGDAVNVTAVEIHHGLCASLRAADRITAVIQDDFLRYSPILPFDRVLMNPPFAMGADVDHILRAVTMLAPGGRLVAICANGPRQAAKLRPLVEEAGGEWIELPEGSFKESGTNVRTVLLTLNA